MKIILSILILSVLSLNLSAKSFKCWTNDEGFRECGNSLPPKYVNQRIDFFNEKSGKVNKFTPAAKSQAQIIAEKEQLKIQKTIEREQAKQKAYDDVLLKTYLSVDDLLLSLRWKVTTLNSSIKVTKGSIQAEQGKFLDTTQKAARVERSGREISKDLSDKLKKSRSRIKNHKLHIKRLEKDITDIHEKFSHDIDRFSIATAQGLTLTLSNDEKAKALNMVQISCNKTLQCDDLWNKAKEFVIENSDLDIVFDTEQVRTTDSPRKADDIALIVVRSSSIYDNIKSEKITLKIRCQPSRSGEQLCKSEKVANFLTTFKKQVQL